MNTMKASLPTWAKSEPAEQRDTAQHSSLPWYVRENVLRDCNGNRIKTDLNAIYVIPVTELDNYKAHAQRLAEACKAIIDAQGWVTIAHADPKYDEALNECVKSLTAWEGAQ